MALNEDKIIIDIVAQVDDSNLPKDLKLVQQQVSEAEKNSQFDIKVNTDEAVQSVKSINKQIKELVLQAAEVGEGGVGFEKLTSKAGELKKKLEDVNEQIAVDKSEGFNKLGNQLNFVKNKLLDLDFSGARKGIESIGASVTGLGPATTAAGAGFRTLAGAIAATGIGVLVIALGYIVTHFNDIKESTGLIGQKVRELTKFFETLIDRGKILIEGLVNGFIEMYNKSDKFRLVIQGIILTFKTLVDYVVKGGKIIANVYGTIGGAIYDAFTGKNPLDRLKKGFEDIQKNVKDFGDNFKKNFNSAVEETANGSLSPVENLFGSFKKEGEKAGKDTAKKFIKGVRDELQASELDIITPATKEKAKKEMSDWLQQFKMKVDETPITLNLQAKIIDESGMETEAPSLLDRIKAKFEDISKDTLSKATGFLTVIQDFVGNIGNLLGELSNRRIDAAEQARDKEIAALDATFKKATVGKKLSVAEQTVLENKLAKDKYKIALDTYNKETELRKKAFKQQKAIQIVQAVISTAQGVVAALSEPFFPLMIARIVLAGVTGATQIGLIASQKFPEGDAAPVAPTPAAVPDVSLPESSSSGTGTKGPDSKFIAPQFFGLGGKQSIDSDADQYRKVYVVESDISDVQKRVNVIEDRARIG